MATKRKAVGQSGQQPPLEVLVAKMRALGVTSASWDDKGNVTALTLGASPQSSGVSVPTVSPDEIRAELRQRLVESAPGHLRASMERYFESEDA